MAFNPRAMLDGFLARWRSIVQDHRLLADHERLANVLLLELYDRRSLRYEITDHEIRMGGEQGFRQWLAVIERDLSPFYCPPQSNAEMLVGNWMHLGIDPAHDEKAEGKAKDLFISVAGIKAFESLERDVGWKIFGNVTKDAYYLYKRASFCITRCKDAVKFCAVVPGVPLWDHLLGIMLMVQHDEARFLRVANKSGELRPGAVIWVAVDEARDFRMV